MHPHERLFLKWVLFVPERGSGLFVFKQVFDAADAAQQVDCLVGEVNGLGVVAFCHFLHHADVF